MTTIWMTMWHLKPSRRVLTICVKRHRQRNGLPSIAAAILTMAASSKRPRLTMPLSIPAGWHSTMKKRCSGIAACVRRCHWCSISSGWTKRSITVPGNAPAAISRTRRMRPAACRMHSSRPCLNRGARNCHLSCSASLISHTKPMAAAMTAPAC